MYYHLCILIAIIGLHMRNISYKFIFFHPIHCVKHVQIRSFFWSVFSWIRRDTKYLSVFSPNAGKNTVFGHISRRYSWEVWHYKDAKTELIKRSIEKFNWQRAFLNISVNEKLVFFNNTVLSILKNFIPPETMMTQRSYMAQIKNKNVSSN